MKKKENNEKDGSEVSPAGGGRNPGERSTLTDDRAHRGLQGFIPWCKCT
jgi:hypothetical protein